MNTLPDMNKEMFNGTVRQTERVLSYDVSQIVPEPVGVSREEQTLRFPQLAGQHQRISLRDGLDLALFDLQINEDVLNEMHVTPCLSICILRNGHGAGSLREPLLEGEASECLTLEYDQHTLLLFYVRQPLNGASIMPGVQRMHGIELNVGLGFLEKLGVLHLFDAVPRNHPMNISFGSSSWVGNMPLPRDVAADTETILQVDQQTPDHDLILESTSLSILRSVFRLMNVRPKKDQLGRDHRAIVKARELIEADLSRAWTVKEVARAVGINEKKLKNGFRQKFGLPVYSFVQRSRLEKARTLLTTDQGSVTETAFEVGYSNPSHFASLFRREFGMTPSEFRRQAISSMDRAPFLMERAAD